MTATMEVPMAMSKVVPIVRVEGEGEKLWF